MSDTLQENAYYSLRNDLMFHMVFTRNEEALCFGGNAGEKI